MSETESEQRYLVSLAGTLSGWDNPQQKLRKAFAEDGFVLFGQSILRLKPSSSDKKPHFEVFVRLQEEEQQLTPPGTFLPMLEYYNMGSQLDRYVVHKLVDAYARPPARDFGVAHLNLCSSTFADKDFCAFIGEELKKKDAPPDCLCFEFPGKGSAYPASAQALAEDLKKLGCRISVGANEDDSIDFTPIKELRADFLKIGGSLIRDLATDQSAATEIKTAARACRTFDVLTIAQYVESAPTLTLLRQLGVDFAQGYGISKPGPLEAMAKG